jgi:RHS repeat-associated protein
MGATTYENDAAGARTGKTNADYWRYVYDGESRLTQVSKNGVSRIDCAYDGNGMRVKKVEDGKTTYYVYSGPNPLIEYSPTDGKYLYRIYAGKQAVAEEKDGVVKFYHKDHLGSTRVVTDAAGVKIAEYKFAPYGEKELSNGDGTEYGFTDKAEDVTTGLQYFGARFYDAECGRFISQDPAKDGANWFAYCTNNPISYIDPDGKKTVAIIVRENICGLWVGTHAAVYVDNPKGEPVLYDPAGSTYTPEDSWGYSARGSGDTFLGEFADLDSYVESYKGNDKKTELIVFNTTAEEESQIAENIDSLGGVGAFLCSTAVSEVLKGIGPFENLENHLFPGGLSKQLNNIKNEGNKEEDNEGESE